MLNYLDGLTDAGFAQEWQRRWFDTAGEPLGLVPSGLILTLASDLSRAQCSTAIARRRRAETRLCGGALQTRDRSRLLRLERSRISGAPLRIAREDGRTTPL